MREVILGPPGTGKTTTLIGIVEEELARGTPPEKIGYVSFTKKAANEAVHRAAKVLGMTVGEAAKHMPYFSTLHSLCFRRLGLGRHDVLEGDRLRVEFANFAGIRISGRWSEDGTLSGFDFGDRCVFMDNLARVRCISLREQYDQNDDGLNWRQLERVSNSMREFKTDRGWWDFTDMLQGFLDSHIKVDLEVLLVDEAQDLSLLQWHVVERLAEGCRRVVVGGDDDQAIYVWSGADVQHLIDMPGDVRVLGQSYRVPPVIQAFANRIVPHMGRRRDKPWTAKTGEDGKIARENEFDAVDLGTEGSVLILVRNTYLLREQVEPALRRLGVEWVRSNDQSSVSRPLMRAIVNWETLRRGEPITITAARQIYDYMTSGKGVARGYKELKQFEEAEREWSMELDRQNVHPKDRPDGMSVMLDDLKGKGGLLRDEGWQEALDRVPLGEVQYLRSLLPKRNEWTRRRYEELMAGGMPESSARRWAREDADRGAAARVRVSTIHSAKGGEADHVVLLREMARRTHHEMKWASEDEARVWYVAVTRARRQLTIVDSQTPQSCPWV